MTEETPVEVGELLKNIRDQFYTDTPEKKFFQDQTILLLAITWPATWLKERGTTWTAQRYFSTLRDLLQEIKRHGATGKIKYFPGYLLKCVQDHFAHNSDAYCDEGKRMRHSWELAIGRAVNSTKLEQVQEAEKTLDVLAQAHRVLATTKRRAKAGKTTENDRSQGSLF